MSFSTPNIAVLISGRGSNLQALIKAQTQNCLPANIELVISNKPDAQGLAYAKQANITHHALPFQHQSREEYDEDLHQIIQNHSQHIDYIVLAGFLRLLSGQFLEHYCGRIINIHPSLLPKYKGLHTHKRVLENNERIHGATMHFVIEALDAGAPIGQISIDIPEQEDDPHNLANTLLPFEHFLTLHSTAWLALELIRFESNTTIFDMQGIAEYCDKRGIPMPISGSPSSESSESPIVQTTNSPLTWHQPPI